MCFMKRMYCNSNENSYHSRTQNAFPSVDIEPHISLLTNCSFSVELNSPSYYLKGFPMYFALKCPSQKEWFYSFETFKPFTSYIVTHGSLILNCCFPKCHNLWCMWLGYKHHKHHFSLLNFTDYCYTYRE